ncbi:uncharacterized protein LY89DRAFT_586981, partial [Mollisia scopiformis]
QLPSLSWQAGESKQLTIVSRRWYHQSQIKNQVLFIDGGIESFSDRSIIQDVCFTFGRYNYIIAIDMNMSWDWESNITEAVINKTLDSPTGNPPPNIQNAALFRGPSQDLQVYLYGGITPSVNQSFPDLQYPTTNQYTLWGFNTETHTWTQYDLFSEVPERPSQGAAAEASDLGLEFYMNGMITQWSSPSTSYLGNQSLFLSGMVILDLNTKTVPSLISSLATNRSTDIVTNGYPRVRGGIIYVPGLGPQGVLVTVGGAIQSSGSLDLGNFFSLVSMDQANIFDVSTALPTYNGSDNGWYTQTIIGTTPEPRVDFCLVLASAPDNSSHNIFMYVGLLSLLGWDPSQQNKYFDEIWVLSLPSFTWIAIYNGTSPRFGHTCHAVGNRQMITIGSVDNVNAADYCDWEFKSVAIYDMTDGGGSRNGWGSVFSPYDAPYQVNDVISAAIGGNLNGNATKLLPNGGWSSTLIAHLFTGTDNQTAPVGLGGMSTTTRSSHIDHTPIIAGTVGGAVALFLVAFLALLWKRYRAAILKKRQQENQQEQFLKTELPNGRDLSTRFSSS